MLTELDLNLLHALYVLLTERHVTRAGQRIGLTQPSMSSALSRLRRYFNDDLLRREGNQYYLTPLAQELLGPLEEMMHQVERAVALRADFDPYTSERELHLQMSDYAMVALTRPLMALAAAEAPGVRIRFDSIDVPFESPVAEHNVDLLIAPSFVKSDQQVPLWKDDWVVVLDAEHPEVGDSLTLRQLGELPYVRFQTAGVLNPADRELARLGVEMQVAASVSSWISAMFLVGGTRSFTLVPQYLGRRFAEPCGGRVLDPPMAIEPIEECLHWRERQAMDPGVAWLRQLVERVAHQLQLSPPGPTGAAGVPARRLYGLPRPAAQHS